MRLIVGLVIAALVALAPLPASAAKFKYGTTGGLKVLVISGEIKGGDARRLTKALESVDRDRHGTKRVYLESDGGMVEEALKMADIMHKAVVTTIVRKDAVCASACASVLFVAGKYRTVEKGGLLAIHSCYDAFTGRAASECNAMISAHADASGVSGVTMMALQEAAGNDTIILFESEDATCFGLTLKPGARPSKKTAPCVKEVMGSR
jgi:hypothetical protein